MLPVWKRSDGLGTKLRWKINVVLWHSCKYNWNGVGGVDTVVEIMRLLSGLREGTGGWVRSDVVKVMDLMQVFHAECRREAIKEAIDKIQGQPDSSPATLVTLDNIRKEIYTLIDEGHQRKLNVS